jgi:hypothetical protein
MRLAKHTEFIVAKRDQRDVEHLPRVKKDLLQQCDGTEDEKGYREGWIAVGRYRGHPLVYSVTSESNDTRQTKSSGISRGASSMDTPAHTRLIKAYSAVRPLTSQKSC